MEIIAEPDVATLIHQQGGRLYVWTRWLRCCARVSFLEASPKPPPDRRFRQVEAEGFDLWFSAPGFDPPEQLHLEVRGRRKPRVEAYWNGCVYAG